MSNLRRYFFEDNICFITNVAYERMPIWLNNVDLIFDSINNIKKSTPFDLIAWAILPDHLHFLFNPEGNDPSKLIQRMKMNFAAYYSKRMQMQQGRIWQNRFWDHINKGSK